MKSFLVFVIEIAYVVEFKIFRCGLHVFRKLFKNPISERWGKQICLN